MSINEKNYYGYALTLKDDKRAPEWEQQRNERGFDSTELWNLDVTIAKFILPRLQALHEVQPVNDFKDIQYALKEIIAGNCLVFDDGKRIQKGLHKLAKNFMGLWC